MPNTGDSLIELIDGVPYIYTEGVSDMKEINTAHGALLLARKLARRDYPQGSPMRLVAERAVRQSRKARKT
jgi:hypothetical protein